MGQGAGVTTLRLISVVRREARPTFDSRSAELSGHGIGDVTKSAEVRRLAFASAVIRDYSQHTDARGAEVPIDLAREHRRRIDAAINAPIVTVVVYISTR